MNKYLLKPVTGTIKEGFILENENGEEVYRGQMTKFKLFVDAPFEFRNMLTNMNEEHKVGKTVMVEHNTGIGIIDVMSKRSWFKYDGVKIWDYLHEQGIRINTTINTNKVGMRYEVTLEGKPLAVIANSSPKGKSILTFSNYFDVECEEKDLDLVFLVAFTLGKTEQTFAD